MPKNSQELVQLAGQWANAVKNDLRTQMVNFIESSHLTEEQVAEVLTLTMGELEQILRGNGECTIMTLTKLLIATGNTLEIKPISQSALGTFKNVNPHVQQKPQHVPHEPAPMPHPHPSARPHGASPYGVDSKGRPLPDPRELFGDRPPMPGHEPSKAEMDAILDEYWAKKNAATVPNNPYAVYAGANESSAHQSSTLPQRDARGRFVKTPTQQLASKFANLNREQLAQLIMDNLWDSEIDIDSSTTETLRDFLQAKDDRLQQRKNGRAQQPAQPATEQQQTPTSDVENFAKAMAHFVAQNPHLRETMKTIFG